MDWSKGCNAQSCFVAQTYLDYSSDAGIVFCFVSPLFWRSRHSFQKGGTDKKGGAMFKDNFGFAIEALKRGDRVARIGWNGKGMFIYLVLNIEGQILNYEPCIFMYTAEGRHQPGWLASQADMLANDWVLVP